MTSTSLIFMGVLLGDFSATGIGGFPAPIGRNRWAGRGAPSVWKHLAVAEALAEGVKLGRGVGVEPVGRRADVGGRDDAAPPQDLLLHLQRGAHAADREPVDRDQDPVEDLLGAGLVARADAVPDLD